MSVQSDAAKKHIEGLLKEAYPLFGAYRTEYRFCDRLWRFDYAVPSLLCANPGLLCNVFDVSRLTQSGGVIELDGGTFQSTRTGHASGVGLRNWREKNNEAMRRGWKVFHYAPEEVIKAGRKVRKWICSDRNHGIRNPAR